MSSTPITSFVTKILTLAGAAAFCYAVVWVSPLTIISRSLSLEHSLFFRQFEQHFWQYSIAFTAVIILSRGHLWSYGINSQNLKSSMIWLSWLYAAVIAVTVLSILMGKELLPTDASGSAAGSAESVIASLVYWMSSPVANQILFYSFLQSVLMKQWGDSVKLSGFPLPVVIASIIFASAAPSSHFGAEPYFFLPTFLLGLFCGTVYWKTNSLITPMLGQAFFFGFPFFIHLLRTGTAQ
jgi:hypothetical protein